MSIERKFSQHYDIPHNGGRIDIEVHIEYESTNWTEDSTGDIDILDAYLSSFKYIKQDTTPPEVKVGEMPPVLFEWKKAVMSDSETESAQAWLDQTPLDFFHDAAFENECEEWNAPPLFLQP
jgi:hypothetical protein